MNITTADVRALRDEAGQAGDLKQAEICTQALDGDDDAWAECERVITSARAQEITLTSQDIVILGRMSGKANSPAAPLAWRGWQPHANDVAKVDSMIERGILEKKPGFDSVQLTEAGYEAWQACLDRQAARHAAENGY